MEQSKMMPLLLLGGAGLVVLVLARGGGASTGATLASAGTDPGAVAVEQARLSGASQAIASLTGAVASIDLGRIQADMQVAQANAALQAVKYQADAQQYIARQQASAQKGQSMWGAIGSIAGGILHAIF